MAYSTVEEVSSEFKDVTFSTTTSVTTADVTRFIAEADAEIDARVGLVYVTPIEATAALKVLKLISVGLVANRIKSILAVKTGSDKADQGEKKSGDPFRAMLREIVEGTMALQGATKNVAGDGVKSYSSSSVCEAHTFKKGEAQW